MIGFLKRAARIGAILAMVAAAASGPSQASAPQASQLPTPRPGGLSPVRESAPVTGRPGRVLAVSPRPVPRPAHGPAPRTVAASPAEPDLAGQVAAAVVVVPPPRTGSAPLPDTREPDTARVVLAASGVAVRMSPRPDPRPDNLRRRSVVRAAGVRSRPSDTLIAGRRGRICGDRSIRGETIPPIPGRLAGCGVSDPVRVVEVSGVALTQASVMDCTTAKALKAWVDGVVKPSIGRLGGGVASLKVAAHYSCRTRNNRPGAKISEHGKGHAIDISAFNLKNGVAITVLRGWRDEVQGRILRRIHSQACGIFGTVLGPKSDRYHQDHFHLDTARHRGGSYCR